MSEITREHALRAAQNAVRNQGYAVALHGSQIWDLDLLAVPWRETCIDAECCAEIIAKAIPGRLLQPVEQKPYGRLAWEIHAFPDEPRWGHGFDRWYVDLSVMPRGADLAALREAAQAAHGDLLKAANQFAGLGFERNATRFEEKAERLRAVLASADSEEER